MERLGKGAALSQLRGPLYHLRDLSSPCSVMHKPVSSNAYLYIGTLRRTPPSLSLIAVDNLPAELRLDLFCVAF